MLYLFDLDDTLISGYLGNPNKDYHTWHVLPGRRERIGRLRLQGDICCVVTNQGGVAFGFVTEDEAQSKIEQVLIATRFYFGCVADYRDTPMYYACYHDTRGKVPYNDPVQAARRKPSGAMIREAIADHPDAAALGVLMVGDRPEDEQAAQAAGVPFQWTHVFFKDVV